MEGLFNLLLESPLLLFFIIAAILSFLQGKGNTKEEGSAGNGRQQQRPPQQRQEQAGRRQQEEKIDWKEIFRQEEQPDERPTRPQPTVTRESRGGWQERSPSSLPTDGEKELSKANKELHEKYERVRERKRKATERADEISDSPIMTGDLTKSKSKIELDFSTISRNEAVKGVVWSEILGKPKSRRRS